ncbi:hypothetical protein AC1031_017451 [Aphanomyces cochlioides]|nr:hypothetical protein AC1031_017451 [Aphanomyces cochlioides]
MADAAMSAETLKSQDIQEKKWWTEDEDTILLTQVNNDRPFLQRKDTTKAWEALATTLRSIPGFTRPSLDGKKCQNRFLLLVRQHKSQDNASTHLSGVCEEETPKTKLLDDIVPLYMDAVGKKKFIRDQAMTRGYRQTPPNAETTEQIATGKRKMVLEAQEMEISLERDKLAFKKMKFEREMEEKEKDREEREKERQERQQIREIESKRNEEMMRIIRHFIERS